MSETMPYTGEILSRLTVRFFLVTLLVLALGVGFAFLAVWVSGEDIEDLDSREEDGPA